MSKIKPILFSGPMVRAILSGKKTQTRRIARKKDGQYMRKHEKGDVLYVKETHTVMHDGIVLFRADVGDTAKLTEPGKRWTPSIFMPKALSRIHLRVVECRLEWLQEISLNDIKAEGCGGFYDFQQLWNGLNKKAGTCWQSDPCVSVTEFTLERFSKND